jgi:hypothetical protein
MHSACPASLSAVCFLLLWHSSSLDLPPHPGGCSCGWAGPPAGTAPEPASRLWRSHIFGSCVVAQAVISAISASLSPAGQPPAPLPAPQAHLWLMHPPSVPALHAGPWRVICLAAVSAMGFGRSALHRLTRLHQPRFWDLLLAATASRPSPPPDWASVGTSHKIPSIGWTTQLWTCYSIEPPACPPAFLVHSLSRELQVRIA